MERIPLSHLVYRIANINDPVLKGKVAKAIGILQRTFALYKFEHISLSFNGGKDSIVILHLLRVALVSNALQLIEEQQRLSASVGEAVHYLRRGSSGPRGSSAAAAAVATMAAAAAAAVQSNGCSHDADVGGAGVTSLATGAAAGGLEAAAAEELGAAAAAGELGAAAGAGGAILAGIEQLQEADAKALAGMNSFYFARTDDFEEVRDFVQEMDKIYGLDCHFLSNPDFKAGLVDFLEEHHTTAIILGTRRGDPNAEGQEYFCPSSEGWPPFMRINPILDWTYHDVWGFLRTTAVGYCLLYDQGYTSLGGVHNTLPNSALKKSDGTFAPAHMLADGRLERVGRATSLRARDSLPMSAADVEPCLTWRAGIVMVGDELLSGKVEDVNTPFLCKELRSIGWSVRRVVLVPDDVSSIAAEVAAMSADCEVVITSGGVGPTLDDVTMEAVAQAFGCNLVRHPELEESLLQYFGRHVTGGHLKLADVPEADTCLLPYTLDNGDTSPFPLVMCRNVFILPGVPHLLRQKWRVVRSQLQAQVQLKPFANRLLRLSCEDEACVAPLLDTLSAEWGNDITIGSYPVTGQEDGTRLLLSLEGKQSAALDSALKRLLELLPKEVVLTVASDVSSLGQQQQQNGSSMSGGSRRGSFQQIRAASPAPPSAA